ncbi:hypothetical protein BGW36DRAFT_422801 [Talaromyces proteolyticus]|uniref:Uncharacterized protein n=1 Tax=Talaromyces proteolyticus TaxID=1131652 RepID=A0AAD4Q4L8_9EURO|nr:uncharacterized protein BGW36DRAFT_422801 [Talaromyces proteolyticus]KAH8703234.1 hypothetical protein BGW36DRAFT_422801 [Talaromyces proteolyticus]
MKMQFTLGLLLPIALAVSAISTLHPIKLDASDMQAIAKPLGNVAIDPTLTCDATYTLAVDCTLNPCTIAVNTFTLTNCTLV